ncbi:MAG: AsmA family protein [Endomicrobium sp.]|jgi:hypothetical protein|nr:AsmA family protein [Endomicrobium sp.]
MKLNLKKTFIFLTIIVGSVLLLYFVIFILYFNNAALLNKTKDTITALTQREVTISEVSCSPRGDFKISNLSLYNSGGGIFLSVKKLSIKISVNKLLKAYFIANKFEVDSFEINLNLDNKRKFNYQELYKEIKDNFNKKYTKYRFIRKMEVEYISIKNGIINLKLDLGNIKIYDILIRSNKFDYANDYFRGTLSFSLKLNSFQTKATCEFNYSKLNKTLKIEDFKCEDLSLHGEGLISFLDSGDVSLEYNAKVNKLKYKSLLILYKLIGIKPININYKDNIEDIIIYHTTIKEKEIKTAI